MGTFRVKVEIKVRIKLSNMYALNAICPADLYLYLLNNIKHCEPNSV